MKKINLLVLTVAAFTLSTPRRAVADPLSAAETALRESVLAPSAVRRQTVVAKATPPQARASADYCVARGSTGPEGMPDFFNFHCTGGVKIPFMRRWCWTLSCLDSFAVDMKAMMRGAGYELAETFHFQAKPASWNGYSVFKKAGSPRESYCLALRYSSQKPDGARYSIDCGDGAVTSLTVAEPGNGTSAAERYMAERGYEPAGRFEEDDRRFSPALFRRRR